MRRYILFITAIALISITSSIYAHPNDRITIIIEVEGDVEEHIEYFKTYHPFIEVITSYSTIFNGLALEGKQADFEKIQTEDFIKAIHKTQTYEAAPVTEVPTLMSQKLENPTTYTGKNIKVAVIDTGIDYTHPDFKKNYTKGYDFHDFDDDPMETLPEEGMPTNHGTHVAGIIAANGEMEGIAKDAQIYAYRGLGPGGFGSTVHILAALEQAVKDKVDIINLSLGNSVNGPDYPTSIAVNKAVALGIPVVIANGNSGPGSWTVGAPATAESALSVGASAAPTTIQTLTLKDKSLTPKTMQGSTPWHLPKRDYQIELATNTEQTNLTGKIALYERGEIHFRELALQAQERGAVAVLIYNSEEGDLFGAIENQDGAITIPVAGISQEVGEWLIKNKDNYIKTNNHQQATTIADFSSRGPVAVNWHIKPDLLAPGTNIKSTVPGGYEIFNGTSMAAPFVTGAIALIKEAHPNWEPSKIYSALKTTAELLTDDESNKPLAPSIQGSGTIQAEQAIITETIIHEPNLHFGKNPAAKKQIKLENLSNTNQHFRFEIPKHEKGITWKLPQSFTVKAQETKTIEIKLQTKSEQLNEGIHEGYLHLTETETNKTYNLPYLFINNTADQPITYGFEFTLKPFTKEEIYEYQIYATEELATFTVDLYDPDTLTHQQRIIDENNLPIGTNKGKINKRELYPGIYQALLTAQSTSGKIQQQETIIIVE